MVMFSVDLSQEEMKNNAKRKPNNTNIRLMVRGFGLQNRQRNADFKEGQGARPSERRQPGGLRVPCYLTVKSTAELPGLPSLVIP